MRGSKHVFVSHSTANVQAANAVCDALEGDRIQCWIAPRDIPPGEPWATAIMNGIKECEAQVIVVSKEANESAEVLREGHLAAKDGIPIFLFRVDREPLSPDLTYFLSTHQFVDIQSSGKPKKGELKSLAASVRASLTEKGVKLPKPRTRSLGLTIAKYAALLLFVLWSAFFVDEWVDHAKNPATAAKNALITLVNLPRDGVWAAPPEGHSHDYMNSELERFTTQVDGQKLSEAETALLEHLLPHFAHLDEFLARKRLLDWTDRAHTRQNREHWFPKEVRDDLIALARLWEAEKGDTAPGVATPDLAEVDAPAGEAGSIREAGSTGEAGSTEEASKQ